tara:strand:- start:241 stop:384 length:144 start_codon:yes stop_codon:yes gene_type:complete
MFPSFGVPPNMTQGHTAINEFVTLSVKNAQTTSQAHIGERQKGYMTF